jgi:hypothetical protein
MPKILGVLKRMKPNAWKSLEREEPLGRTGS